MNKELIALLDAASAAATRVRQAERARWAEIRDFIGPALLALDVEARKGSNAAHPRRTAAYKRRFAEYVRDHADLVWLIGNDSSKAKLLWVMENIVEIEAWRSKLPAAQQEAWNNHATLWKEYRKALAPPKEDKPNATLEDKIKRLRKDPQVARYLEQQAEHIAELEAGRHGSTLADTEKTEDVIATVTRMPFSNAKLRKIANGILAVVREREKKLN